MKQRVTVQVNTGPVPQVRMAWPAGNCDMIAEPELRAEPGRFTGHNPQANQTGRSGCDTHTDAGNRNRSNPAILLHPSPSVYPITGVALHRFNPDNAFDAVRTAHPRAPYPYLIRPLRSG
ncbi:MAG: hypothetical protein R6X14_08605 [bacterium]